MNGALVEVLAGPLAGTTRQADGNGEFELASPDAVSGASAKLRISRDGIQTRTADATWGRPPRNRSSAYWVDTLEPPIGLDPGEYALSVSIDLAAATDHPSFRHAPCQGFPDALAVRNYPATIRMGSPVDMFDRVVQTDPGRLARNIGLWFPIGHLFSFAVVGPLVRFDMEEEGILEELPGFRYLDIHGANAGTEPVVSEGSSLSVPVKALFGYCELTSPRGYNVYCSSAPRDVVIDSHICVAERATMVFTKR